MTTLSNGGVGRLYVIEEAEESFGPVKIGITTGMSPHRVPAGFKRGNWRTLSVVYDEEVPYRTMRWREWLIHERLLPWHRNREWFDVRPLAESYPTWGEFIEATYAGSIPGCMSHPIGNAHHHLVGIRRAADRTLQFEAECACGFIVGGAPNSTFERMMARYFVEHLGHRPSDPLVKSLSRRRIDRGRIDLWGAHDI